MADEDEPKTEEVEIIPSAPVPAADAFGFAFDHAAAAWLDGLRSSPITQANNGAWAHLQDQLPRLKGLLEAELKG